MRFQTLFTGAAVALISTSAMAADYVIDVPGQHAFVGFKASHLGYSYIIGGFNTFEGSFTHDTDDYSASKVSVTIDASSLDTNHEERDTHLRSADFLDADEYPTITFESTAYSEDEGHGKLSGNLTMHGVTKPIVIDVQHIGEGDDPWGGYRAGFSATTSIKRSDFGMDYNLGPASESMDFDLFIEGVRK